MVNCRTQDGKIVLSNIIPIVGDVAEQLEAALKANKNQVSAMSKDLHIDLWIEAGKNGEKTIIAERKFSKENEIDVIEEVKSLRIAHQRFVEALMKMSTEPQEHQPEETAEVHDKEAEEFLSYALVCKLQELVDSCGAIIIALPK